MRTVVLLTLRVIVVIVVFNLTIQIEIEIQNDFPFDITLAIQLEAEATKKGDGGSTLHAGIQNHLQIPLLTTEGQHDLHQTSTNPTLAMLRVHPQASDLSSMLVRLLDPDHADDLAGRGLA